MARSVRKTPEQISEKWNRRLKQAIPDIVSGIDSVSEAPGVKAAAKATKMRDNLVKSVDSGRWGKAVAAVPLSEWQSKTKQKVQERLASGVDSAMGKRRAFDEYLVKTQNEILVGLEKMPDMTLEDSIARMRYQVESMAKRPYKK